MKITTKLMLLILVLCTFALPMVLTGPNGRPIMTLEDWLPAFSLADIGLLRDTGGESQPLTTKLEKSEDNIAGSEDMFAPQPESLHSSAATVSAGSGQMYKWQDKQGRWHFSNQRPADLNNALVEDLPTVKNVMDAPVNRGENSSTISLPDLANTGELLERLQRAAGNDE